MKKEHLQKLRESRKPESIFDSEEYSIEKIPCNWRIVIKLPHKYSRRKIDRDIYTSDELSLNDAHESAKSYIDEFFYRKDENGYKEAMKEQHNGFGCVSV